MLLGLDFDGTLAPIVPRPEDAALPPAPGACCSRSPPGPIRRSRWSAAAASRTCANASAIDSLFYAGNHGLEIEGPACTGSTTPPRPHARGSPPWPSASSSLADVDGAIVEDKGLTLSVHYRLVRDRDQAARVRDAARTAGAADPSLRVSDGKKVVEIRPAVDWHKGRALAFLRETLGVGTGAGAVLFVGDDRTDEDAFRVLGDDGWGIIVADPPPADTAARAMLRSTAEVVGFLQQLV
jgi:trehalose 6-phosphate phosphatase